MTDTRMRADAPPEDSTGQLVSRMTEQVSELVRDELALAKLEMTQKAKHAGTGVGMLGGAGVLALYGVGALLVTIGALLALVLPIWASALIVAAVLFVIAGVAGLMGKKQVQEAVPPAPTAAVESSKKDVDAVKAAVKDGRHS